MLSRWAPSFTTVNTSPSMRLHVLWIRKPSKSKKGRGSLKQTAVHGPLEYSGPPSKGTIRRPFVDEVFQPWAFLGRAQSISPKFFTRTVPFSIVWSLAHRAQDFSNDLEHPKGMDTPNTRPQRGKQGIFHPRSSEWPSHYKTTWFLQSFSKKLLTILKGLIFDFASNGT